MKTVTGEKLITCIMPCGRALPVLEALKEQLGILANIHHARGTGRMTPLAWRGVGETAEKDIVFLHAAVLATVQQSFSARVHGRSGFIH